MVDPAVFASVGIDADGGTGFAFGFGIDRCAQMRHGIADMRALIGVNCGGAERDRGGVSGGGEV